LFNGVADQLAMPRANFWLVLALAFSTVLAALFFVISGGSLIVGLIGGGVGMTGAAATGVLPVWILFAFIAIGAAIAYALKGN